MAPLNEPSPAALAETASALRSAAAELVESAWQEGIDPMAPLGVFVRAQERVILALGDTMAGLDSSFKSAIETAAGGFADTGRLEVEKLLLANELAGKLVYHARTAQASFDIQRDILLGRLIDSFAPRLAESLKDWVVLRERAHAAAALWRRSLLTLTLVSLVFAAGYGLRFWEDAPVRAALSQCAANAFAQSGKFYCEIPPPDLGVLN